ncbi:hypothetical protein CY35_05G104100 [Sphagnum magellanicum]|nr:hypothetical protein CY35_05G104100 [Sphagnum magellanicum]
MSIGWGCKLICQDFFPPIQLWLHLWYGREAIPCRRECCRLWSLHGCGNGHDLLHTSQSKTLKKSLKGVNQCSLLLLLPK